MELDCNLHTFQTSAWIRERIGEQVLRKTSKRLENRMAGNDETRMQPSGPAKNSAWIRTQDGKHDARQTPNQMQSLTVGRICAGIPGKGKEQNLASVFRDRLMSDFHPYAPPRVETYPLPKGVIVHSWA